MKTAIITGASSGIGVALARALTTRGYRVALLARRRELLEEECAALQAQGHTAMALVCDVADRAQVAAAVAEVEGAWGSVDLAVANAGIGKQTPVHRLDLDALEEIMRINFFGAAYLLKAVLPGMLERHAGHFVGIASLAGLRGMPRHGAYAASKAALQLFLESARIELAPRGVRVTTVNPGWVATPMTAGNTYKMPFIRTPEQAAATIVSAIEHGRTELDFPGPIASAMRVARLLPNWAFDRLIRQAYPVSRKSDASGATAGH